MNTIHEITLAEELNIDIVAVTTDRFKTTDSMTFSIPFPNRRKDSQNNTLEESVNLLQLSEQSDFHIANKLRKDLENLTWMLNNPRKIQPTEDSEILMVSSIFKSD